MNRKTMVVLVLAAILAGCNFPKIIDHHEAFRLQMDRQVGRILDIPTSPTFSGRSNVKRKDGYEFEFENGCRVFVEVEEETNKILGWNYLSNPDRCEIVVNWFGPW